MVDPLPMADPIVMVDPIPMADPILMVDAISMVDPIPMVDPISIYHPHYVLPSTPVNRAISSCFSSFRSLFFGQFQISKPYTLRWNTYPQFDPYP